MYLVFTCVQGDVALVDFMYLVFTRVQGDVPLVDFMYLVFTRVQGDVPLVDFTYLAFTRVPGKSYCRRLGSLLLCLCYVFRALINSTLYGLIVSV